MKKDFEADFGTGWGKRTSDILGSFSTVCRTARSPAVCGSGKMRARNGVFMQKVIITVVGKDCVGIMAKVCTYLAEKQINILDISQTIVSGYFNMMMVADRQLDKNHFEDTAKELEELGSSIGVVIRMQREEIFNMMHRI